MYKKLLSKAVYFFLSFNLLFQSTAPAFVFAQETLTTDPTPTEQVTPTPEPTSEPTPDPTPIEEITPTETIAPSPTEEIFPTPEETITPEPSPTPTEQVTPTPEPTSEPTPDPTPQILEPAANTDPAPTVTAAPNIFTDKLDYSPTDIVTITGTNFSILTSYIIIIASSDDPAVRHEGNILTDSTGTFTYSYQLDGNYRPNYTIEVKLDSQLITSTTFTDNDNGAGNCLGVPDSQKDEEESDGFSLIAPIGYTVSGLSIKSGSTCFGTYIADNTYENSVNPEDDSQIIGNSCYQVTGIGTTTASAVKVGTGKDQTCQDISHIEINITPVSEQEYACNNSVYAINNNKGFYWLDKTTGNLQNISTLLNGSSASADDPFNNRTYYINRYGDQLRYYDHELDTDNFVGNTGITNSPFTKLAFNQYGELYALTDIHDLYLVDISNATVSLLGNVSGITTGGDISFDESDTLYLIGTDGKLFTINLSTLSATLVKSTSLSIVTGLAYLDGIFYVSTAVNNYSKADIYTMDKLGNNIQKLNTEAQNSINDLSSCLPGKERPQPKGIIQGTKYYDENRNGVHDYNKNKFSPYEDRLLNGWTIRLYDSNWEYIDQTVTSNLGNQGQYRFEQEPGTYYVCEVNQVNQTGWSQTGPLLGAQSVDNNHNVTSNGIAVENDSPNTSSEGSVCWQTDLESNVTDGWLKFGNAEFSDVTICKQDNNETPLSGWRVGLLGSLIQSLTIPADTSTINTNSLPKDDYVVWTQGYYRFANWGEAGIADSGFSLRVPGQPYSYHSNPFNTWVSGDDLGTIGGLELKVNGLNIDWGYFNPSHNYLHSLVDFSGPLSFSIYDNNVSDNNNSGDNPLIANIHQGYSGTTEESGCITFTDVPYGTYIVQEVLKQNWENISGQGNTLEVNSPSETFTLSNRLITSSISGFKYESEGDGTTVQPLDGWLITLYNSNQEEVESQHTDSQGAFSFDDLLPGDYSLIEQLLSGWTQVYHPSLISLIAGVDSENNNFGNFKNVYISGKKFNDIDQDHVYHSADDTVLSGWTIRLDLDGTSQPPICLSGTSVTAQTNGEYCEVLTDQDGKYKFEDLGPGTYTVSEIEVDGWTQTRPDVNYGGEGHQADGTYVLTVSSGKNISSRDFGNHRDTGILLVQKVVDDQSDLTQWYFSLDGGEPVQADENGWVDFGQVTTLDPHTITESGPGDLYHLVSISDNCNPDGDTAYPTVSTEGLTCTFTNERDTGTITVDKVTDPGEVEDLFTINLPGLLQKAEHWRRTG